MAARPGRGRKKPRARVSKARGAIAPPGEADAASSFATWVERVRETEELFRTTVDNMPVNLVLLDRDCRVLYVNPPLAQMTEALCGLAPEDLIGQPAGEVWPAHVWTPLLGHIERAVATGERQTYELETAGPGRPLVVRQWSVVPMKGIDGGVRRILAMSHDVTAQRRLLDELREADRRKSEFISVLSHELRNPLAAIRTSLYVVDHPETKAAAAARARKVIDRQVSALARMVDDLLDVTRIAQNKIELRRAHLDFNELVRETTEDNREHLESGGVSLELKLADRPLFVDADGARLGQVVTNLLSNAAKFTPRGGTATVSVAAAGDATVVLRVLDTGSGIEPALLETLFEPFIQGVRTLDRTEGGLGLGLALVRGIVTLHGGQVHATSAGTGKGAELVVRLPLSERRAPAAASPTGALPAVSRRVLVIEDDPAIAEGLRLVLELEGHAVETAHDGAAGIVKARGFKPDVVLCDIGLPGMDGYQVARAFKADEALRSAHLVALSGYAQSGDLALARRSGFDEHLAKPASMETIRDAVARASLPD